MRRKTRQKLSHIILVVILTVIALLYIYPVALMFMNSVKPFGEVIQSSRSGRLSRRRSRFRRSRHSEIICMSERRSSISGSCGTM